MKGRFNPEDEKISQIMLRRDKSAISTELDGETVILNTETGMYSGLDPVGTSIWNLLKNTTSFADLEAGIQAEYSVTEEQCFTDLCGFLEDLLTNHLIEIIDDESH